MPQKKIQHVYQDKKNNVTFGTNLLQLLDFLTNVLSNKSWVISPTQQQVVFWVNAPGSWVEQIEEPKPQLGFIVKLLLEETGNLTKVGGGA